MSVRANAALSAIIALSMTGSGCAERLPDTSVSYVSDNNFASGDIPENADTDLYSFDDADGEKSELEIARAMAGKFMDGLLNRNTETLMQYGGAQSFSAYSFLDGVYLTDWEIVDSVVYDGSDSAEDRIVTYKIKINVSESSCELFPEGESLWELDVTDSDNSYFSSFRKEGTSVDSVTADRMGEPGFSTAVKMSYAFTSEFGWLRGENKIIDTGCIDKLVEKERFVSNLIGFCRYFNKTEDMLKNENVYSAEWLSESADKLLGINGIDVASMPCYDAEGGTVSDTESGYCFGYSTLVSEAYDKETGISTVVLDWYADTIYLAKACTFTYTLEDNGDGTMKLVSVHKSCDSGEKPVFFMKKFDINS